MDAKKILNSAGHHTMSKEKVHIRYGHIGQSVLHEPMILETEDTKCQTTFWKMMFIAIVCGMKLSVCVILSYKIFKNINSRPLDGVSKVRIIK